MSRSTASFLTIRSLTALSKVSSSLTSCDSTKTLCLLKNLSTAIERFDFQNPNGYYEDDSLQNDQNPNGFCTEQSSVDFQQKPNEHGLNPNGGFTERRINDYRDNPLRQNGNCGFYGQNRGGLKQNRIDNCQKASGGYRESFSSEQQRNIVGENGNFKGHYGQIDGYGKQNSNGIYGESSRGFQQNSNEFYQHHGGVNSESHINEFQNNTFQQNGNFNDYGWYNNGQPHPNLSGAQPQMSRSGGNANVQNQYGPIHYGPGEVMQNRNGFNSQRFSESLGSFNGNCMQDTGQHQQALSGHYSGNFGIHQNSPSVYQQDQNGGQYQWDQSRRQYQQNPNEGQYQSYSGNIQNGMMASQVLNNCKHEDDFAEASKSSQNNGTLEQLDGLVKEGKVKEAVEVLGLLEKQCISVDLPTFSQLMQACGDAKAPEEAKAVHEHVERLLSPLRVSTYNGILKMYSECGSMDDAFSVFSNMTERDLTSWDTMITGLAKNGLGEDAVDIFSQFKQAGLKPDDQIFIGVFSACSALGDVVEGMLHFESMNKDYGIVPSMKHYVSIVDMLGSTGYLDEAQEFIEKMPMEPDVDIWEKLMNLCRMHGNLELGDRCAEIAEQLDPSRLNEKSKAGLVPVNASELAKEKENKKLASQNLLEVRSKVHEYRAGDTSHPETDKIYALIRGLRAQMKEAGYIPETRFVLHDIDQEGKEEALLAHSERLAVSHGLLSSPARAPIRIMKNLRVCGDCHSALKIISKIVGRELIIRDAKRFHHFKDGLCSCRDYW
ncbi:hypothetical protein AB3S75_018864 [Citrus x aurantiifolia]